jgi:pantetheine-phosphate adenylyltransferase
MIRAIYPGSFDPVTLGHLDIIKRTAAIVDELVVGVLVNKAKNPLFSTDERVSMLNEVMKDIPNAYAEASEGLLVDFAREKQANVIIRGLRMVTDFEYELQIAQTNRMMDPDIETMFMMTSLEYSYLSSNTVREAVAFGADISKFVPAQLVSRINEKRNQCKENL